MKENKKIKETILITFIIISFIALLFADRTLFNDISRDVFYYIGLPIEIILIMLIIIPNKFRKKMVYLLTEKEDVKNPIPIDMDLNNLKIKNFKSTVKKISVMFITISGFNLYLCMVLTLGVLYSNEILGDKKEIIYEREVTARFNANTPEGSASIHIFPPINRKTTFWVSNSLKNELDIYDKIIISMSKGFWNYNSVNYIKKK